MVDPADALQRIAYHLERTRAETYKVRAFRGAARALKGLEPGEVESLASAGRLRELPGVGDTTAKVIMEALRGEVPRYLQELEGRTGPEPTTSAEAQQLRALLKGDCHSHSDWSDGG